MKCAILIFHNKKIYKRWLMDGTFKTVLEWYQQMFTIHVFKEYKLNTDNWYIPVLKDANKEVLLL
ncbi:hypothetical protein T07_5335 [Trichinella nelsoni]|uniref:Uncharacterized protein n=1 Tax=Trichinella nelsoni TaxID=6336 RepID=A0A0V0S9V5_9BILA|nr:hypothetical protein T07_5335 [Trichinella nelsoni]